MKVIIYLQFASYFLYIFFNIIFTGLDKLVNILQNKSGTYIDIAKLIKYQKNINAKNDIDYEYTALHYGSTTRKKKKLKIKNFKFLQHQAMVMKT